MAASFLFIIYVLLAAPAPHATMADVAFMAGHWRDTAAEGLSEEIWTAPEGDAMLGMWRFVSAAR